MKCTHEGCTQKPAPGKKHGMCKEHWAEYMRGYRELSDKKRERVAHFRGFEEGVAACVRYLREKVGERAWTGYQTAKLLEKSITSSESPELAQRRAMLNLMRP